MWEDRDFRIRLREGAIRDFEKIMLSGSDCDIFMSMGFMSEGGREYGMYECSGFAPLSGYRVERTEDAMYILENVLIILNRSVEYLIDPTRVRITEDTVFYNKDTGQIKIAYVPLEKYETDMKKNLVRFIDVLKRGIRDGYAGYLSQAAEYIMYRDHRLREMTDKVGVLKRQIEEEKRKRAS